MNIKLSTNSYAIKYAVFVAEFKRTTSANTKRTKISKPISSIASMFFIFGGEIQNFVEEVIVSTLIVNNKKVLFLAALSQII